MTAEYYALAQKAPRGHGTIRGLMARPATPPARLPAVLVVHENRGLNPYIEDVVRRTAKAGYLAFGPDGLTRSAAIRATTRKAARCKANSTARS
jgi:carboxymethylenebutenolidase